MHYTTATVLSMLRATTSVISVPVRVGPMAVSMPMRGVVVIAYTFLYRIKNNHATDGTQINHPKRRKVL